MHQINELGVGIAIDDFGTGYSSLNYLKAFPIQTLKIDDSFVKDVPHDPKAVAICRTIASLGKGLGLKVVAEGVEEQIKCDFLRSEGINMIQGYLVSHPLDAQQFEAWIKSKPLDQS